MYNEKACCFIGHRRVKNQAALGNELFELIKKLIETESFGKFIFGSRGEFNDLCCQALRKAKESYPEINRVYIRAEYPIINDDYRRYLSQFCDDTYYPERIVDAGRAAYVERNFEMIDKSELCVFYFDAKNPSRGTRTAYEYAVKKDKRMINLFI